MRGGVRALQQGQSEVGFDLRLRLEVERKRRSRAPPRRWSARARRSRSTRARPRTTSRSSCATKRELVVVTNGLLVATALADAPGITVLVTGGMLRLSAMSLVGDLGTDVLRTTRINKGFLGARGLSLERGLMDLNPDEVRIKQEMADACEQVYGILDGTKWHRSALLALRPARGPRPASSPTRARPRTRSRPGARRASSVVTADPGPREAPPLRPRDLRRAVRERRSGRLMTTMAAVDLGAQSGRVAVGTFDGERLAVDEVHRFANEPVTQRRHAALGLSTALPGQRSTGCARPRARRRSTRSRSTPGPSTSGSSTRDGRLLGEPRALPRRAPRRRRRARASNASRRASSTSAPASSCSRSTPSSSWPRMAAENDPALARRDTLLLIPDLVHSLAVRKPRRPS